MTRLALPLLLLALVGCTQELVCPQGKTDCDGRCVSLLTDAGNCGACGVTVGDLGACVDGAPSCAPDVGLCGSTCTDLARDPENCGTCGLACGAAQFCMTEGETTGCTDACPGGFTACDRACVELASDLRNCGACGVACAANELCVDGGCRAELQVACYATTEVVPVNAALAPAGAPRPVPAGPTSLAVAGQTLYAANGYPQASVSVLPLDRSLAARHVTVDGWDLQHVGAHGGAILVSNAAIGTLLFLNPAGDVVGELAMPRQQAFPNPRGFAVVGSTAYVALGGDGTGGGQSVATVDVSGIADCTAAPPTGACGAVASEIHLDEIAGTADAPGLPFPADVVAAGGMAYVTLSNLREDTVSCGDGCSYTAWVKPAGNGRLAIIDNEAGDSVTIVDLGAGCGNPGAMAVDGDTLWIACGSFSYPGLAPPVALPVDLTTRPPTVGTPIDFPGMVPGRLAFCGGVGYLTDQASGAVVRFDPVARTVETPVTVCDSSTYGWAWAADVACGL